ncbi:MAG TPA: endolytic transglycosylase MltG [Pseudomonadales bacterium]|jgi:UPF0755 protein
MRKFMWRFLPIAFGLLVLSVLVVWRGIDGWMDTPLDLPEEQRVYEVPAGAGVRAVFAEFEQSGWVRSAEPMRWYLRLHRDAYRVNAGEYLLTRGDTPRTVLAKLAAGQVVQYAITFPEGWTLQQMLAALQAQSSLKHTVADPQQLPALLGMPAGSSAEGWLLPETYHYHKGLSDLDIIRVAYTDMQSVLQRLWPERDQGLPYETPYEALIMASLIEKETGTASERPEIAGVFVRRLQKNMRLQTDPAVIYGLGDRYQGNLTKAHLREPGPYNTYLNKGLPPTPIAMPGEAAIFAALHPAPGNTLYFVAKGDGSHAFSATLAEHEAAVQRYQVRKRSQNYRSSPAQ